MRENVELMLGFQAAFLTLDPEEACRRYLSADFELHEPPELPQGGVFHGPDAPLRVSAIYRTIWDVEFLSSELLDTEDPEVVVARYVITWTNRKTGKSMTQPVVELNTIRGGKIARMDVFHFNPAGLLDTMEQAAGS